MSTSKRPASTGGAGPRIAQSKRGSQKKEAGQAVFQPNAAGIDIGAREIYIAVPADRDNDPVRKCGTFTSDLDQMAEWLVSCGITTVAMESTGVYWIPVYDAAERHGIEPCLVNPRNMKNVPGKRTDFHECQWIQHLHSLGLLHAAFRPESEVCAVRSLMRHRNDLVQMASQHVQHMQKALTQMNVQFQHVISDLTGLTGLAILDAILAGERDPAVLAKLRDPRIKADQETIRKSLEGNWRVEHLLVLKQRLSLYRSYRDQIHDCDKEIEKLVAAFAPQVDPAAKPLPEDRKKRQRQRKNKSGSPDFDMRTEAYKLFGVDLTQIPCAKAKRTDDAGLHAVQRSGAGHVAMAHCGALRLLVGIVPGQRHQRRQGAMERCSPHQEPSRDTVPDGGQFPVSRTEPDWGLPPPDESEVRSDRWYDRNSAQDRCHFLHDGQESDGIRCLALGKT